MRKQSSGDGRVNEFSGLTTQHVVWVREHNRLEDSLHRINPHWNGERLFQETRRLVIAVWQMCIYNEYLPLILGPKVMDSLGLTLSESGHWNGLCNRHYCNSCHCQIHQLLKAKSVCTILLL